MNHTFDSYQPMAKGKVGGRETVFLFQWRTEQLRLTASCS